MVLVQMNASILKRSFAKSRLHVGKLAPSRKYTWVIALLRDGELDAPTTGFQLFSYNLLKTNLMGVRFYEATAIKTCKCLLPQ